MEKANFIKLWLWNTFKKFSLFSYDHGNKHVMMLETSSRIYRWTSWGGGGPHLFFFLSANDVTKCICDRTLTRSASFPHLICLPALTVFFLQFPADIPANVNLPEKCFWKWEVQSLPEITRKGKKTGMACLSPPSKVEF